VAILYVPHVFNPFFQKHKQINNPLYAQKISINRVYKVFITENRSIVSLTNMDISEFPKNWMVIRLIEQKNVQNNEHKGSLLGSKNELSPIYDQNVGQVQDFRSTIRESMGVPKEHATIRQTISRQDSGFHNPENYICKEHGKKMEFVCLNHQCRVCANCALVGIHKNHDIRSEEEVLKEIARKADKLVEVFEGIETTQTVMPQDLFNELFQRKLKEKSRELEDRVHRRFEVKNIIL